MADLSLNSSGAGAGVVSAQENAKDFIPSGTTQNSFDIRVVKRLGATWRSRPEFQHEWWKAPVYQPGEQPTRGRVSAYVVPGTENGSLAWDSLRRSRDLLPHGLNHLQLKPVTSRR